MTFQRKTLSLVTKIGLGVSVLVGLIVALIVYLDEVDSAAKAQRFLKSGTVVSAVPTSASSSTTRKRRGGSSTTYTIHYAFADAQGRRIQGSDQASAAEYGALRDPTNPNVIRANARVDVVYDRANASNNGLKSRFESQSVVDMTNVALAGGMSLVVALLILWGVRGYMKKRLAPEPVPAAPSGWQPPPPAGWQPPPTG